MTEQVDSREELFVDAMKVAQSIVRNPMVRNAVQRGFEVRDQALQAQTAMLAALNLPTAEDLAQLASRLRSMSQRFDQIEDALARIDQGVTRLQAAEQARAAREQALAAERTESVEK